MIHTKGPWKVLFELNRTGYDRVVAANDVRVIVANDVYAKDAVLIAAAPEMLDILKMLDKRMDLERKETPHADGRYFFGAFHAEIKSLIARAEGRE